jgi:hypothetical protein
LYTTEHPDLSAAVINLHLGDAAARPFADGCTNWACPSSSTPATRPCWLPVSGRMSRSFQSRRRPSRSSPPYKVSSDESCNNTQQLLSACIGTDPSW